MKQPPSIQPASVPGPDYDPLDWIVQDLENVQTFLDHVEATKDAKYMHSHLVSFLEIRRRVSQQIEHLADDPYNYPHDKLQKLHEENEKIFAGVEAAAQAADPWNAKEFKRHKKMVERVISNFDRDVTP
ncbi:MAG: hypothetical protein JSR58_07895 [Verrucomicrobia bacterium]|nr:hypothetical protein [Verrucomicrobiota bacterium]